MEMPRCPESWVGYTDNFFFYSQDFLFTWNDGLAYQRYISNPETKGGYKCL